MEELTTAQLEGLEVERRTPVKTASWRNLMPEYEVYDSVSGGLVRFYGPFEMPDFSGSEQDEIVESVNDVNIRLDTMANRYYGDAALWWVIAARNNLDVPDAMIYKGMVLKVPSKRWVQDNLLGRTRTQVRMAE